MIAMDEVKVMREWNALRSYPRPELRLIPGRTIEHRILASYRGRDFFDGPRECGYGGMVYDGRWEAVARDICADYTPKSVIQLECEKGFLLHDLQALGVEVVGVESSSYARRWSVIPLCPAIPDREPFDLCLALGMVYTLPLGAAMNTLRRIEQLAHKAFVTLAAYDTEGDLRLFRRWTLLGATILKREEWIEVLKHCGYTGDYWFVTAHSLKLKDQGST